MGLGGNSMTKIDPEIKDNDREGVGDESKYDHEAVSSIPYDHKQFELPVDFEVDADA